MRACQRLFLCVINQCVMGCIRGVFFVPKVFLRWLLDCCGGYRAGVALGGGAGLSGSGFVLRVSTLCVPGGGGVS